MMLEMLSNFDNDISSATQFLVSKGYSLDDLGQYSVGEILDLWDIIK